MGDNVRLSNGASAVVKEVTSEALTLDFNPAMAGKALTFEVELVKLTKVATPGYFIRLCRCHFYAALLVSDCTFGTF